MDLQLDAETCISTGPLQPPQPLIPVQWERHARQAVHLFSRPLKAVTPNDRLHYKFTFKPRTGDVQFEFSVVRATP